MALLKSSTERALAELRAVPPNPDSAKVLADAELDWKSSPSSFLGS